MPTANFAVSRSRQAPVMAKVESTYGTDVTPSPTADGLNTYDSEIVWMPEITSFEMRSHGQSFTRPLDVIGMRFGKMRFKAWFCGSGTAGDATTVGFAGLAACLAACGMTITDNGVTLTISPSTVASLKSATIKTNHNGQLHTLLGAIGNVTMSASSRSGIECSFEFSGLYVAPAAVSTTFDSFTGGANRATPFLGVAMTLTPSGGSAYTPVGASWGFDAGVQMETLENFNSSTGVEAIINVDRAPKMNVVISQDNYASAALTYPNIWANLLASTTHAVGFAYGTTPNLCTFSAPAAQLVPGTTPQAAGGHRNVNLQYKLQHTTAESEWSFVIS